LQIALAAAALTDTILQVRHQRMRLIVCIGIVLLSACDLPQTGLPSQTTMKKMQADYDAALRNATNSVQYAQEFSHLFPGSRAYFGYYNGLVGPSKLNMETLLFDRYQLSMQVPVTFDRPRRTIKSFGAPEFLLNEVTEVTQIRKEGRWPDGSRSIATNLSLRGRSMRNFGAREWKKIVEAGGDFSLIGITLLTNSPAPGFEDLRKNWEMRMSRQL
jgi:hypothetical protein